MTLIAPSVKQEDALAHSHVSAESARASDAAERPATTVRGTPDILLAGATPQSARTSSIIACMPSWIRCFCASLRPLPSWMDIAWFI